MPSVGYLQQLLVIEMIAWIELEDEHMIDTWRPPAVRVDAEHEDEQDDEERASVHTQSWMPVHLACSHLIIHCTHMHTIHWSHSISSDTDGIVSTGFRHATPTLEHHNTPKLRVSGSSSFSAH